MSSCKYQQLSASIREVGLIEPLSVARPEALNGGMLLLDGHMRLLALKEMGETEAPCLIAADDETYTYNNRINRLSTIQEHYMLRRAIERGVSKERLARAFNLDITSIDKRMNLLDGVTAGAVVLLRDQQFTPEVARVLRKMRPERQVEAVELMLAANAINVTYAEALLNATPREQLADKDRPLRDKPGVNAEKLAKLERELGKVQGQYQRAEQTYGADLLHLTVAKSYLARLLGNEEIRRYLSLHQPEILSEFQALVDIETQEAKISAAVMDVQDEGDAPAIEQENNSDSVDGLKAQQNDGKAGPVADTVHLVPIVKAA
jgi:ParB-like chromosome segregation protein Spo0J